MALNTLTWQRCLATLAPSGTIEITENGEYDVAQYATADVNVSGGGSGDFSTAQITMNITPPEGYEITEESISTGIDFPNYNLGYGANLVSENRIISNVLLYNNECLIYDIYCISGFDSLVLDYENMTTSGDITYDAEENVFIVSGSGAINGSYVVGE